MSKKRMGIGWVIIAAIALFYAGICGYLCAEQEKFIFHPARLPADFRFDFTSTFKEVTLDARDAKLSALHFTVPDSQGVILYFHGNAGSLRSWGDVAKQFTERGYDIFIIDYRGYGKSTGHLHGEKGLLSDAELAYAEVAKHYAPDKIIVYGRSIGSGVAAYVANKHTPRLLILETPYYNFLELARSHMPFFPSFLVRYPLRTDKWLASVKCPVYLFHGDRDELIPYASSERLLSLIKSEHRLFTIPGGGHNNLDNFSEYEDGLNAIL